ncbi:MAG: aspartyl/glutamyl-tRNA amidotransferase subunit C [Patescibacteria group bacterium]|nr:aspartyl/glutamyl-tRNA amidotransferase subunit C [Patescibacteria group bacterium]
MGDKVDVAALAKLSRLEVSAEELRALEKEIPDILSFVETIKEAHGSTSSPRAGSGLQNVMREDGEPHESGKYTKELLDAAPAREGDRILVKQVIKRK